MFSKRNILADIVKDSLCSPVYKDKRTQAERDRDKGFENVPLSSVGGDDCFVATAVYGSPDCYEVNTLRNIRDDIKNNVFGDMFVRFYYSGFGKNAAKMIKNHAPSLIPPLKTGLDYIVDKYSKNSL